MTHNTIPSTIANIVWPEKNSCRLHLSVPFAVLGNIKAAATLLTQCVNRAWVVTFLTIKKMKPTMIPSMLVNFARLEENFSTQLLLVPFAVLANIKTVAALPMQCVNLALVVTFLTTK